MCVTIFGRSKQPLQWWLHSYLLSQSCWMHWDPHAGACIQGIYVICCCKGNQWCWRTYLLRGEIKQLVVKWTGTSVEFHHSYDDFDRFNSYGGCMELLLSLDSAVQTRDFLQTIQTTWMNGQHIWVSETLTWRLDQSLSILEAYQLPFFPFLRNITLKEMEFKLQWRNNKSPIERF